MDKLFRHIIPERVLDIGANIGDFSKKILLYSPQSQVIMVEANPNCEPYLKAIGFPYDIVALSDHPGQADLYVENSNHIATGASLYKENTQWYEEGKYHKLHVATKTLDACNYFEGLPIDLIKLDVQGSELDVIEGGKKTIQSARYVLIEVSLLEYNQGAPLIDKIVEKMINFGFCMIDIVEYHRTNDIIFQMDILFKK